MVTQTQGQTPTQASRQGALSDDWGLPPGTTRVGKNVWFHDQEGVRAVFVGNQPFFTYPLHDRKLHQFCACQLAETGLAKCYQITKAFQISERTLLRLRRCLQEGGIDALPGKPGPKGRHKATPDISQAIARLYQKGFSTYEVADQLGLCDRTVRVVLQEKGIPLRARQTKTVPLPFPPLPDESQTAVDSAEHTTVQPDFIDTRPRTATTIVGHDDQAAGQGTCGSVCTASSLESVIEIPPSSSSKNPKGLVPTMPFTTAQSESLATAASESPATAATELPSTEPSASEPPKVEATSIPYASELNQFFTKLGMIEEAPVVYETAQGVAGAGVLLGLALLPDTHLLDEARNVYGRLKNAWYGLRPVLWTLIVMALLRIKRPEQIKQHDPASLGRLLGLPRAAEVKTLRRKVSEVARRGLAATLHRRLAVRRAEAQQAQLATLYVDGHVRVYHGKHKIGKTYVTKRKSVMRGETDYWLHLANGQPLLVVHDEANESFAEIMKKKILPEIRQVVGRRSVTVVFDRAGWSKDLFDAVLEFGFDLITYRKGPYADVEEEKFSEQSLCRGGREVSYVIAEEEFREAGWPPLRLIAVPRKDGGQTHILASGELTWQALPSAPAERLPDVPAVEVAWTMFGRWSQENWFKYMAEEFALDVLVDYQVEADDVDRLVPNSAWRKLDREVAAARGKLQEAESQYARLSLQLAEQESAETCRGRAGGGAKGEGVGIGDESGGGVSQPAACTCGACQLQTQKEKIAEARDRLAALRERRRDTPKKIRLGDAPDRDPVKLSYERKLFTDTVKLCAYDIETQLTEMLSGPFHRHSFEGRSLIRAIFQTSGDLVVKEGELHVHLDQLCAPRYTVAMMSLCEQLNARRLTLPETDLRLRFYVKPRPDEIG
jgi:transposase